MIQSMIKWSPQYSFFTIIYYKVSLIDVYDAILRTIVLLHIEVARLLVKITVLLPNATRRRNLTTIIVELRSNYSFRQNKFFFSLRSDSKDLLHQTKICQLQLQRHLEKDQDGFWNNNDQNQRVEYHYKNKTNIDTFRQQRTKVTCLFFTTVIF